MKCTRDWNKTEAAGDFAKLPTGGYVCAISGIRDVPEKEYLELDYDIVDGPMRGYFTEMRKRVNWKCGYFMRSYKEGAAGFFRVFLDAVEASNPGRFSVASFNNDENKLYRMYIGIVLGEEEYLSTKNGEIKTRVTPTKFLPIQDIRDGKFEIPPLKKYDGDKAPPPPAPSYASNADFEEIAGDEDLPF